MLDVRDLSFTHPDGTVALRNVSFHLAEGETLALLGPNGSGKTTLLLTLNGVLRGTGTVRLRGTELTPKTAAEIRTRIGIVFQNADDQLFMPTVLDDVTFGLRNLGQSREEAIESARAVLSDVGVPEALYSKAPYHLSAGEKRRVALAGVLVMKPDLILLDEPTTSLDPPGQRALAQLLKSLPQAKIISTHDAYFARAVSERGLFLDAGRAVADGALDRIIERFDWSV